MLLLSPSLSTYALSQCVVAAAQFAAGDISFYDSHAELTATDADGNSTSPLRVEYAALTHFRIVRAQGLMRLTLPRPTVLRWARHNAFASQLDADDDASDDTDAAAAAAVTDPHGDGGGGGTVRTARGHAKAPPPLSRSSDVVLLLQLADEPDMMNFLQAVAPLVAASRRTRSASRISVTEPLPVRGVLVRDPAPSVCDDATPSPSPRASTASAAAAEGEGEEEEETAAGADTGAADAVEATPTGDALGPPRPSDPVATLRALADAPQLLLGGESERTTASASSHGSPALRARPGPQSTRAAAVQPASPSRLAQTLDSVADELAELLEDTEYPGYARGGAGGGRGGEAPLPRRPVDAVVKLMCGSGTARGRGPPRRGTDRRRNGAGVVSPAAASECPSLHSSAVVDAAAPQRQHRHEPHGRQQPPRRALAHGSTPHTTPPAAAAMSEDLENGPAVQPRDGAACVEARGDGPSARAPRAADHRAPETPLPVCTEEGVLLQHPGRRAASSRSSPAQQVASTSSAERTLVQAVAHELAPRPAKGSEEACGAVSTKANPCAAVSSLRATSCDRSSARLGDILAVPFTGAPDVAMASSRATSPPPPPSSARRCAAFPERAQAPPASLPLTPPPARSAAVAGCSAADISAYLRCIFPREDGVPGRRPGRRVAKPSVATPTPAAAGVGGSTAQGKSATSRRRGQWPPAKKSTPHASTTVPPAGTANTAAAATATAAAAAPPRQRVRSPTADAQAAATHRSKRLKPDNEDIPAAVGGRAPPPLSSSHAVQPRPTTAAVRDARELGLVETPARAASISPLRDQDGMTCDKQAPAVLPGGAATTSATAAASAEESKTRNGAAESRLERCPEAARRRESARGGGVGADVAVAASPTQPLTRLSKLTPTPFRDVCASGAVRAGSVTSSQATCPLLYGRDSRKERRRRVLRYMNIISQSVAAVHEAQDALRGLLLLMMEETQL